MKKCRTAFCRGRSFPHHHSPYCSKCRSRRFKERHPLKYSFGKLAARAKERGHEFSLTFEQYQNFAVKTGYDWLKGKTKHSLSIHRKDNSKGYHVDNIAAVTLSLNSRIQFSNMPAWLRDEMMEVERQAALSQQEAFV